jgi:hypothetical protein
MQAEYLILDPTRPFLDGLEDPALLEALADMALDVPALVVLPPVAG